MMPPRYIKTPVLTVAEMVERFHAGESVGMISLRAKIPHMHARQLLVDAGVQLRTMSEAVRLGNERRRARHRARVTR